MGKIAGPVVLAAIAVALGLLAYDAGARAATAYRALHGEGQPGIFVVESCGSRGCTGSFRGEARTRRGNVIIDGRYRPGEHVPAVIIGGQALPRERSAYVYPGVVAVVSTLGLAGVVGYGIVRRLTRRTRSRTRS